MYSVRLHPRRRTPALWLALFAALAVAGLQSVELGHLHGADDIAEHCLLCIADTPCAADTAEKTDTAPAPFAPLVAAATTAAIQPFLQPPRARGPPIHS